jgi:tryptophan-rich sensory protein
MQRYPSPFPIRIQAIGLLAWTVVTFAAAAVGGFASSQAGSFYADLARPSWAPPGWLFGPVWTLLYALMAVAVWLVWRSGGFRSAGSALTLYLLQLAANSMWTWLFFAWRQGGLAFAEILVLWALIAATILAFWRISRIAGVLLLPYLAWVSFAAALTYATWTLNPGVLS